MKDSFLNRLTTWLWSFIVLVIVILAMYTSFGRLLTNNLAPYQEQILRELNARSSVLVEVDELKGRWESLTPTIELTGLRILGNEHAPVGIEIQELRASIDVLGSLLNRTIQLYVLNAQGVQMHVDILEDGQLSLAGIPGGGGSVGSPLYDFIFNAEYMGIEDVSIHLHDDTGLREIQVETRLEREEEFRRFSLSLLSPSRNSWFRVVAEGNGDLIDLSKFEGRFHLQSSVGNLDFYSELLAQSGLEAGRGKLDAELWLGLEKGEVRLAANIDATDFELHGVTDEPRSIDFDTLSATLRANYNGDTWTFGASDLQLVRAEQSLAIDRLSGEYANNSLVLRTEDIEIARYVDYLEQAGLLPEAITEILSELSPRGQLVRTELQLLDLDDLSRWRLASEFAQLTVEPWRAAPGVENASGYVSMGAREGYVQLDSSEFSMAFPVIYDRPLSYREFTAELRWEVGEELFHLSSGPFSGQAEEGVVNGLFALRFPLQKTEVGAEMDLVIGMRDTDPVHREKYLPKTLSPKLLDWLGPSIGKGRISEGAFIYRGALAKHLPQHRTVQLFFDVEDVELDYHPDWPPLAALEGLVVIDNANVDVDASRARLLDSEARDIELRLRRDANKHLQLGLSSQILGSAADGLTVVNTSPLRKIVGDSFASWQLRGGLRTDLQLQLDLTDLSIPPQIEVMTDWDAVEVDTGALGITLEAVSGQLRFDSQNGFSAEGITGRLWGEPVRGRVSQGRAGEDLATLDVAFQGQVSAEDLREWLQLDLLRIAQGSSEIEMHVLVPPGEAARLELSSELEGMSLDLPLPWGKLSQEARTLHLAMPLGPLPRRIMLDLEQQVYLGVLQGDVGYLGASIGFGAPLAAVESGLVLLGGEVDSLDWDEWLDFTNRNLLAGEDGTGLGVALGGWLRAGELKIFGLQFTDVLADVESLENSWKIDLQTDWGKGSVLLADDLSRAELDLASLDISGAIASLDGQFTELNPGESNLPELKVSIAELRDGSDIWGDVSFQLHDDGADYRVNDIRGKLGGLQLGDEEGMQLLWLGSGEATHTRLSGTLTFQNFGEVLAAYQVEEVVETSSGRVGLDLAWPGPPTDFVLTATSGRMEVDVGEGSFLKTSGAAEGTLRVVGILNLAEFVRRLSLDLSYVFKSGVPFDSINGELLFLQGLVDVPQMDVVGPTSRFQFVGQANIPESRIDGELVATLPIASNLPWMFALVSGLPAAAAVYVISKLFNKQVDRFSSAIYTVEGPWADPEVKFQRIFDNTAEQENEQTAEGEIDALEHEPET